MRDSYTRYPRPILWLVREGQVTIGGDHPDSQPAFEAEVGSFYLSKLPITNVQFEAHDPEYVRAPSSPGDDDPAVGVSYHQAKGYCDWFAEVSRKPMRLPTEIEWEYACRAGTAGPTFFAADERERFCWDRQTAGGAERVPRLAAKRPNPFGLIGMLGGVWEWTGSLHLPYPAASDDGHDAPDAPGPRVVRGGSFRSPPAEIGAAVRRGLDPESHPEDVGFRLARSF